MLETAEKTINQQQQMLQRRENVKETLQKHKVGITPNKELA